MNQKQLQRMRDGKGFIAAMDQSGGSTPKALSYYGIPDSTYSSEKEMFDLVHQMRTRVITSPDDPSALEPGDVLVAPITDPSWTPLFVTAAAVVVDVGAPFSHAAIVSRELGIPCVVSATDATKRIVDGSFIEVNGTTGAVTVA